MKTPNEWWQEFRYRNDHPTDIIKAIQDDAAAEANKLAWEKVSELGTTHLTLEEANNLLDETYRTYITADPRSHLLRRIRIFRGG